jgi:hypothetical protein
MDYRLFIIADRYRINHLINILFDGQIVITQVTVKTKSIYEIAQLEVVKDPDRAR